jgi:hypothetical protein
MAAATALLSAGAFVNGAAGAASAGPHGARLPTAGVSFGRAVEIRLPAMAGAEPDAFLFTVDCLRGGECVAGGEYESGSINNPREHPVIVTESRGRWARGRELALPAAAQGLVTSIDCTGPGACVAVGDYWLAGAAQVGFVVNESSGRWGRARRLGPPSNAMPRTRSSVNAVACPRPGSCAVLGWYVDVRGTETWVAAESGGRWQRAQEIRPPSGTPSSNRIVEPSAMACPRAGACVAVGSYVGPTAGFWAFAVSQPGGRWRQAVQVRAPSNASTPPQAGLVSVSCPGPGSCVAAGSYETTSGRQQGMVASDSRGRWQRAEVLSQLPPDASVTAFSGLEAIACPSAISCVAVGGYQNAAGGFSTMYLPRSRGAWGNAVELALPRNAAAPHTTDPTAEDCFGPGNCAIVGAYFVTRVGWEPMAALTR